eukprot:gene12626-13825_t
MGSDHVRQASDRTRVEAAIIGQGDLWKQLAQRGCELAREDCLRLSKNGTESHQCERPEASASSSAFEEAPTFGLLSFHQLLRLVAPRVPIRFSRIGSAAFSGQFDLQHGYTG